MMTVLNRLVAVACLTASFGAMAGTASYGDHAVVSCKTATLLVSAFSVSYDSTANPSAGCAATLKALSIENMQLLGTDTDSNTIVYTLGYFPYSNK
ncbi:MAG: hypothetical protein ACHQAX_07900 [Gammaproteobacteria bacterium]